MYAVGNAQLHLDGRLYFVVISTVLTSYRQGSPSTIHSARSRTISHSHDLLAPALDLIPYADCAINLNNRPCPVQSFGVNARDIHHYSSIPLSAVNPVWLPGSQR